MSERTIPGSGEAAESQRVGIATERLLHDWGSAWARARLYLGALGFGEPERTELGKGAAVRAATESETDGPGDALGDTMASLRGLLLEKVPRSANLPREDEFLAWRLAAAFAGGAARVAEGGVAPPASRRRLASMPPLARVSMSSNRFVRRLLRLSIEASPSRSERAPGPHAPRLPGRARGIGSFGRRPWSWAARRRRTLLSVLVMIPSVIAAGFMLDVLPHKGREPLELAIAICFGALFGWISIGFWTAVLGFFLLVSRRDRFAVTRTDGLDRKPLEPGVHTAIVMPICEEPVARVFAGLRAIQRSLERTGCLDRYHFFVLSDTSDPGTAMQEEAAWFDWCRAVNGFGRIFYRRRRVRVHRKMGNVADFCRRWGSRYRYMIMLDADSVMSGETLVRLTQLMEANPGVGMIQTAPVAVNQRSLFGRVQQFASRLYGPIFTAGLHYWQLGEGQYWGHNTIIRVKPFMEHCALPRLPGKPPLGGDILSHDFVEAALMGRAGWALWLAYDLPGSWEETPSSLLEEMTRDRRWCQGNIQHLRLLPSEGLYGAHRALFINGVLSYVSALLWFCFLVLGTTEAIWEALREPVYFPTGYSLFPEWPIWKPEWAAALFGVTAAILFLPKVLSILLVLIRGEARAFGGVRGLVSSSLLETAMSSLFAPIRMVFHTRFVLANLLGRTVGWRSAIRGDSETSWREALRHHGLDTLVASGWAAAVYWLSPTYFWWLTPVVVALMVSVPVSVWSSRARAGRRARAAGLLLTPEESHPPAELVDLSRDLASAESAAAREPSWRRDGFVRAVVDPLLNAVHSALQGPPRSLHPSLRGARRKLLERALTEGPAALGSAQRNQLLRDPELLGEIHRSVWCIEDPDQAARWGLVASEPS